MPNRTIWCPNVILLDPGNLTKFPVNEIGVILKMFIKDTNLLYVKIGDLSDEKIRKIFVNDSITKHKLQAKKTLDSLSKIKQKLNKKNYKDSNNELINEKKAIENINNNNLKTKNLLIENKDTINNSEVLNLKKEQIKPKVENSNKKDSKPYDLILISAITIFLYLITLTLSLTNVIRKANHRKIWNILLLITFLVSCLFGLFLVVQINYDFAMDYFSTLLYWHVEVGIAMSLISIFHILWHLKYFKSIIQKKNKAS